MRSLNIEKPHQSNQRVTSRSFTGTFYIKVDFHQSVVYINFTTYPELLLSFCLLYLLASPHWCLSHEFVVYFEQNWLGYPWEPNPTVKKKRISQSINQSINQSVSQSISQSASQSASQSVSQLVNQSISQSVSQSISQLVSLTVQSVSQSASQPFVQLIINTKLLHAYIHTYLCICSQ